MDEYRGFAGHLSASEWSKQYDGLKRNYDSMTRICKEKCSRNNTLDAEITKLSQIKEKYDQLQVTNEESVLQNNALMQENEGLNHSVTELQKTLNTSQGNTNELKQSLKYKSKTQMELEETIQKLSKSLAETEEYKYITQRRMKESNISIKDLEIQIKELQNECETIQTSVTDLKSEKQRLDTNIIQKENIILSIQNKLKQMNSKYSDRNKEYEIMSKDYDEMEQKYKESDSKCANYHIEIDILTNRLEHFENNNNMSTENENERIEKLREIISELETQNKYNMSTIDQLTEIKLESIQFKEKYNELKASNDTAEEQMKETQNKYDNLQKNYQINNEKYNKLQKQFNKTEIENHSLTHTMREKETELEQMHKQYIGLNNAYNDLQTQYQSYIHKKNKKKLSNMDEIKILSERQTLLKNDFQRLLMENEEWIKKYNNLKATYDALNDDYINCKNHLISVESLLSETKSLQQKNIKQLSETNANKISELNKKLKIFNDEMTSLKNENIILRNKPTLTISEYTLLCDKERQLSEIINKLYISDQACEPSFKCNVCLSLFIDPITCQPCGHSFCKKCIEKNKNICKDCQVKVKYFNNEILENLTNTFKLRFKTYLPTLQQIAHRKTNVLGVK